MAKRYKVVVDVFNGGKYGRNGQYIAIVEPQFFKNGNMKKTGFALVERLETIKEGYNFNSIAAKSERIAKVLQEI